MSGYDDNDFPSVDYTVYYSGFHHSIEGDWRILPDDNRRYTTGHWLMSDSVAEANHEYIEEESDGMGGVLYQRSKRQWIFNFDDDDARALAYDIAEGLENYIILCDTIYSEIEYEKTRAAIEDYQVEELAYDLWGDMEPQRGLLRDWTREDEQIELRYALADILWECQIGSGDDPYYDKKRAKALARKEPWYDETNRILRELWEAE